MWLSVLAFGRQAEALERHRKGELLSVAVDGTSQWTGAERRTWQGWQVIADSVISARTARLGGKKGQQGQATDALNRAKQQAGMMIRTGITYRFKRRVTEAGAIRLF